MKKNDSLIMCNSYLCEVAHNVSWQGSIQNNIFVGVITN